VQVRSNSGGPIDWTSIVRSILDRFSSDFVYLLLFNCLYHFCLLIHVLYVTNFTLWHRYIPHFFYLEFRYSFLTVLRTIKPCSIRVRIHLLIFWSSDLLISHRTHELCPHRPSPLPFPSTSSPTLGSYTWSSSPTSRLSFSTTKDISGLCSRAPDFKWTSLLTTISTYEPPGSSLSCPQTHTHNLPKRLVVLQHCKTLVRSVLQ